MLKKNLRPGTEDCPDSTMTDEGNILEVVCKWFSRSLQYNRTTKEVRRFLHYIEWRGHEF